MIVYPRTKPKGNLKIDISPWNYKACLSIFPMIHSFVSKLTDSIQADSEGILIWRQNSAVNRTAATPWWDLDSLQHFSDSHNDPWVSSCETSRFLLFIPPAEIVKPPSFYHRDRFGFQVKTRYHSKFKYVTDWILLEIHALVGEFVNVLCMLKYFVNVYKVHGKLISLESYLRLAVGHFCFG